MGWGYHSPLNHPTSCCFAPPVSFFFETNSEALLCRHNVWGCYVGRQGKEIFQVFNKVPPSWAFFRLEVGFRAISSCTGQYEGTVDTIPRECYISLTARCMPGSLKVFSLLPKIQGRHVHSLARCTHSAHPFGSIVLFGFFLFTLLVESEKYILLWRTELVSLYNYSTPHIF